MLWYMICWIMSNLLCTHRCECIYIQAAKRINNIVNRNVRARKYSDSWHYTLTGYTSNSAESILTFEYDMTNDIVRMDLWALKSVLRLLQTKVSCTTITITMTIIIRIIVFKYFQCCWQTRIRYVTTA